MASNWDLPDTVYFKALFLAKDYQRCIAACRNSLSADSGSAQRMFAHAYLALSHDEAARGVFTRSEGKLPAIVRAQQVYDEALRSMPTAEQCAESLLNAPEENASDPFTEGMKASAISRYPSSATLGVLEQALVLPKPSSAPTAFPIRAHSPRGYTIFGNTPGIITSDDDDLESHDSFNQILTPTRAPKLERDYSSMSLLQPRPLPQQQISYGLMRPIRMGEVASQYHVPPKMLRFSRDTAQSGPLRLHTGPGFAFPGHKQFLSPSEQASPVASAPVSPLGPESVVSDASTISALSPDTPSGESIIPEAGLRFVQQVSATGVEHHLEGLRTQLQRHIELLEQHKEQIIRTRLEREKARNNSTNAGRLTALTYASATDRRVQESCSFFASTPQQMKAIALQRRVEAGRERGWTRARFDPTRYRELAEKALAEL